MLRFPYAIYIILISVFQKRFGVVLSIRPVGQRQR